MKTGMSMSTVDGAVEEIQKFCEQLVIDSHKVIQLTMNLKLCIAESQKDEGITIR